MKTSSNGNYVYTVKCLIDELKQFKDNQLVFIIGHDSNSRFYEKAFYKIEEDADKKEIYLYCGKLEREKKLK